MDVRETEKLTDNIRLKSGPMLTIIAAIVTILTGLMGVLLQQYLAIAQFLVITIACGVVICVLIWLPKRVSEDTAKHLKYLGDKVEKHIKITKDHGKEISALHNIVSDLYIELIEGTEDWISWARFWRDVTHLIDIIEADETFHPDVVLSIGRSGAMVGALLAGNMGGLRHLSIDRINEWQKQKNRIYRVVTIVPPLRTFARLLEGKEVLCVMAECDSGTTLHKVLEEITAIEGVGAVKTAVLFRNITSIFVADYVSKEDRGDRPEFPFRTSEWPRTSQGPSSLT